jgi:hypothetical protein
MGVDFGGNGIFREKQQRRFTRNGVFYQLQGPERVVFRRTVVYNPAAF